MIGNSMASKFRLIDEAYNLVRHFSPESCAIYAADLAANAPASRRCDTPHSCSTYEANESPSSQSDDLFGLGFWCADSMLSDTRQDGDSSANPMEPNGEPMGLNAELMESNVGPMEPNAKPLVLGVDSSGPLAESMGLNAGPLGPNAETLGPATESMEPTADSAGTDRRSMALNAGARENAQNAGLDDEVQGAQSAEPKAESVEPDAQSVEPKAESVEPGAQSVEPKAESV